MAERSIGKTPDVIIHGKSDKPYEQIFVSLETTSRDDYRRALESPNIIEGEVIEDGDNRSAPIGVDKGAPGNGGNAEQSETERNADHIRSARSEDSGDDLDNEGSAENVASDSPGERRSLAIREDPETEAQRRASEIAERRKRIAEARKRKDDIQKAKNRRYAARASGATSVDDLPWLIEYKTTGKSGYFQAKLWPPDAVTPEIADRIETAEALTNIGV